MRPTVRCGWCRRPPCDYPTCDTSPCGLLDAESEVATAIVTEDYEAPESGRGGEA